MKKDYNEFLKQVEKYLTEHKYDPNINLTTDVLNPFVKYYKQRDISISDYTKENFDEYFKTVCTTPNSSGATRNNLAKAFTNIGYDDVSKVIRSADRTFKTVYFKDFEALDEGIEKVRRENFSSLEGAPADCCDSYTVKQVLMYLAWIGVPREIIPQMPLSSINLDENFVDGGRKYPFGNCPKIVEVLKKYVESDTFVGVKNQNGKKYFKTYQYQGDMLIRTGAKTPVTSAGIRTILFKLKNTFENETYTYYNVFRSGQFFRGFQRLKTGIIPDFSGSENLWKYFGVWLETYPEKNSFENEWKAYLKCMQPPLD